MIGALAMTASSASAVPRGLPYSGELVGPTGSPYTGSIDVEASLYSGEAGGEPIWGPVEFQSVSAINGSFSVLLDDATTPIADALEGAESAWLEFAVKPNESTGWVSLEGRQQVFAVAFAHQSGNADRLGGMPASVFLTATEVDTDFARKDDLASVATSGRYGDLIDRPDLTGYAISADLSGVCFSGSFEDLLDQPDLSVFVTVDALAAVATSGSYDDLANRPDLAVYALSGDLAIVAQSGRYDDLLGKPDLGAYALLSSLETVATTGDYFDLSNRPDLSIFAESTDLAAVASSGQYADLIGKPDLAVYALVASLALVATSGDYTDLANAPDLSAYALKEALANVAESGQYDDLSGKPDLAAFARLTDLAPVAVGGAYADLVGAPDPEALLWRDGSRALIGDLDFAGHSLKSVALDPSSTPPENPTTGQAWFDTTAQALKVYTDTGWHEIPTSGSDGKIPESLLPFSKGDLLAPADRPLVEELTSYSTSYFEIGALEISASSAGAVKQGVAFGPGSQLVGGLLPPMGTATEDNVCSGKTFSHGDWSLATGNATASPHLTPENLRSGVTVRDSCGLVVEGQLETGALGIENGACELQTGCERFCCIEVHNGSGNECAHIFGPTCTCPPERPYPLDNQTFGACRARYTCPSPNARFVVYETSNYNGSATYTRWNAAPNEWTDWTYCASNVEGERPTCRTTLCIE